MTPIKILQEIAIMREGGRILARIMDELIVQVRPGVSTAQLDKIAEGKILKAGAKPAFKDYQGFPATLCASVNEEVVHAIPHLQKVLRRYGAYGASRRN